MNNDSDSDARLPMNPYDFQNPVRNPETFAGRTSELAEIRYYLDLAEHSATPMHLALMGPRASGKTSLLNMVEVEADIRNYCPVYLYLTESDVVSELTFFQKVFDATISEACQRGAFGGLTANTYLTYRLMVDSYTIPDDKKFCPFFFPMQFANAMRQVDSTVPASDFALLHDLAKITSELQTVLVIAIDEADVITKNPTILQRIRGILQKSSRVMLVFAGTPQMFPLMDDVFSPIARQFKRLSIRPYLRLSEIRDCILNPLKTAGIEEPLDHFDEETFAELLQIEGIAGGSPYELQLICHHLYRQYELGHTPKMELTPSVFENVLIQLETSNDAARHSLIREMRSWDPSKLRALGRLCVSSGFATFAQIEWIARALRGATDEDITALECDLQWLIGKGAVELNEDIIHFAGSEFERLYSKYLSRQQNVNAYAADLPLNVVVTVELLTRVFAGSSIEARKFELPVIDRIGQQNLISAVRNLSNGAIPIDLVQSDPQMVAEAYKIHLFNQDVAEVVIIQTELVAVNVVASFPFIRGHAGMLWDPESVEHAVNELGHSVLQHGGDLRIDRISVSVSSEDNLISTIAQTNDEQLIKRLCAWHLLQMYEHYTEERNILDAVRHAKLLAALDPEPATGNNHAYLQLTRGDYEQAYAILEGIVLSDISPSQTPLITYNLGIAELMLGAEDQASQRFAAAEELAGGLASGDRECLCLLIPILLPQEEPELSLIEEFEIDLLDAARRASEVLQTMRNKR